MANAQLHHPPAETNGHRHLFGATNTKPLVYSSPLEITHIAPPKKLKDFWKLCQELLSLRVPAHEPQSIPIPHSDQQNQNLRQQTTTQSRYFKTSVYINNFPGILLPGKHYAFLTMPVDASHQDKWTSRIKDELVGEALKKLTRIRCAEPELIMISDQKGNTGPCMVLTCWNDDTCETEVGREQTRERIQKQVRSFQTVKESPFACKVIIDEVGLLARNSIDPSLNVESAAIRLEADLNNFGNTFVGLPITGFSSNLPWCTLGGIIRVGTRTYGITVAHPFRGQRQGAGGVPRTTDGIDSIDDGSDSDLDNSLFESHHIHTKMDLQPPTKRDCLLSGQAQHPVVQRRRDRLQEFASIIAMSPKSSTDAPTLDWALIEIDKNLITRHNHYVHPASQDTVHLKTSCTNTLEFGSIVTIVTGRSGVQDAVIGKPNVRISIDGLALTVQEVLTSQPLLPGDSGSWVVRGSEVVGCVVAGKRLLPVGYMLPIDAIFADVESRLGRGPVSLVQDHAVVAGHEILAPLGSQQCDLSTVTQDDSASISDSGESRFPSLGFSLRQSISSNEYHSTMPADQLHIQTFSRNSSQRNSWFEQDRPPPKTNRSSQPEIELSPLGEPRGEAFQSLKGKDQASLPKPMLEPMVDNSWFRKGDALFSSLTWSGRVMVLNLALSTALVVTNHTIVAQAIPTIVDHFGSFNHIGWYGAAWFLAMNFSMSALNRMSVQPNLSVVYFISVICFCMGQAVCGTTKGSITLIVGRAIAGLGAGGILKSARAFFALTSHPQRTQLYLATTSVSILWAIFWLLGPIIGGRLAHLDWRWCFYIQLLLGGILITLCVLQFVLTKQARSRALLAMKSFAHNKKERRHVVQACKSIALKLSAKEIRKSILKLLEVLQTTVLALLLIIPLQWGGLEYSWRNWRPLLCLSLLVFLSIPIVSWQMRRRGGYRGRITSWGWSSAMKRMIFRAPLIFLNAAFMIFVYWAPVWFQVASNRGPQDSGIYFLPAPAGLLFGTIVLGLSSDLRNQIRIVSRPPAGITRGVILVLLALFIGGSGLLLTWGVDVTVNVDNPRIYWSEVLLGIGGGVVVAETLQQILTPRRLKFQETVGLRGSTAQSLGCAIFLVVAQTIFNNIWARERPRFRPEALYQHPETFGLEDVRAVFQKPLQALLQDTRERRSHLSTNDARAIRGIYKRSMVGIWYLLLGMTPGSLFMYYRWLRFQWNSDEEEMSMVLDEVAEDKDKDRSERPAEDIDIVLSDYPSEYP